MHRKPLLSLLDAYLSRHPEETATVHRITCFVKGHPDCFHRELTCGHITASAWLTDRAGCRVLLTHHRKLKKWLQPGGHADGEADVLAVALREAEEETGLEGITPVSADIFDVDVHLIPATSTGEAHLHYDIRFALRAGTDEAFSVSTESIALRWVQIPQLERYTKEPSLHRMKCKWERFFS